MKYIAAMRVVTLSGATSAQLFPVKPVRFVVASGPGGSTPDAFAKFIKSETVKYAGAVKRCRYSRQMKSRNAIH